MKSDPGTYALILQNLADAKVQIGHWRQIDLEPGYYLYVGSAFGPGGVNARVSRHCRPKKPNRWHIDYLREFVSPLGAWYTHETERLEHRWAHILCDMSDMSSIEGFGCSDCKCHSHLFQSCTALDLALFASMAGSKVELWRYQGGGRHGTDQRCE